MNNTHFKYTGADEEKTRKGEYSHHFLARVKLGFLSADNYYGILTSDEKKLTDSQINKSLCQIDDSDFKEMLSGVAGASDAFCGAMLNNLECSLGDVTFKKFDSQKKAVYGSHKYWR